MSASAATNASGGGDANSGSSASSGGSGANPVFIGTDNRCCFCLTLRFFFSFKDVYFIVYTIYMMLYKSLTLRTGSVIVGVVNALVSTLLFSW